MVGLTGMMIHSLAFCQKGIITIGAGPVMGFPVSNKNFSYYYKNGIGGSLQANIGMTKLGSITTKVFFLSMGAKKPPVTEKTSLTIIKGGYRTNFSDSRFFVDADAGFAKYGSGNGHFVIGGTVGYSFEISKGSYIDLFPSYSQIFGTGSNRMWLTAHVLYRFSLKNKRK